ncbi:MAG: hypothetical protein KA764_12615 [Anaerolineales bacterium]|nr:hypothetical protein [Anaerolineales bacterium]
MIRREAAPPYDDRARWPGWWAAWQGWPRSPIFRSELRYWERRLGGGWRLSDGLAWLALFNLCLLPAALLIYPPLLVGYGLLDEALGWLMALPAVWGVVRERRGQTWALLRATPLSASEIVLGKLAALTALTREGAGLVARARWLGTALALPLFGLMLITDRSSPFTAAWPAWGGAALLGGAYGLFIYRPQINALSGACLGLACSTLEPRVGVSLAYALAAGGALALSGLLLLLVIAGPPLAAGVFGPSLLAGRLEQIFVWLLPWAIFTLGRAGLIPAGLAWTVWRLPHLEE